MHSNGHYGEWTVQMLGDLSASQEQVYYMKIIIVYQFNYYQKDLMRCVSFFHRYGSGYTIELKLNPTDLLTSNERPKERKRSILKKTGTAIGKSLSKMFSSASIMIERKSFNSEVTKALIQETIPNAEFVEEHQVRFVTSVRYIVRLDHDILAMWMQYHLFMLNLHAGAPDLSRG